MEIRKGLLRCFLISIIKYTTALPECGFVDPNLKMFICISSGVSDVVLKRGFVPEIDTIEFIAFPGCRITVLSHDSLQQPSVKYLDLSDNSLEHLEFDTFTNMPSLRYLNVSSNLFSKLPVSLFVTTTHLLVLDLKDNFLTTLDLGIFHPLKKLRALDLSWNNFVGEDLNPLLFENNIHMTYISFAGNFMNNTPENLLKPLESLEMLNLNGCTLEEVPRFATQPYLKTMKELDLTLNQISRLDNENAFVHLQNLEILKIAQNGLQYIGEKVLAPLKNLKGIELQYNNLKYISANLFRNMIFLENIDLSHNLITKISDGMFLCNPLKTLNLSFNRLTYLEEGFLRVTNIIEFYFHQNPWQCVCLKEILHDVHHLHVLYKADVPGCMKPICVTTLDVRCIRDETKNNVFWKMYDELTNAGRIWGTGCYTFSH